MEKEIINIVLDELKKRNLIHETKSSYKNTESLLYNYELLKKSINDYKKQINDLKMYGINKGTSAVHVIVCNNIVKDDDATIINNRINNLMQAIARTNAVILHINRLLVDLEKDKYYDIIPLKYFNNKTLEEIAELLKCDTSTIARNRSRLLNKLKVLIFPNNVIDELGY